MKKTIEILAGIGILSAACYLSYLYVQNKTPAPVTAAPVTTTGKLLYGFSFYGVPVDYSNPLNTMAANTDYLKQNPDVAKNWTDKDAFGNVVGWSHFIIYGQHENRTWDGFPSTAQNAVSPTA